MENEELFKELIKDLTIHKEPCYSLSDCIESLPKSELKEIAFNLRYREASAESVTREFIKKQINNEINAIYDFAPQELIFSTFKAISKYCNIEFPFSKSATDKINFIKDDDDFIYDIGFLASRCVVFVFENKGNITYVVPDETKEYLLKLVASDPNLNNAGKKEEFHEYAAVLACLYGVCPAQVFISLWNRDHAENQFKSKEDFKKQIENCYLVTTHFNLTGSTIYYPDLGSDIIKRIKENREGLDVYMPTKDEIKEHFRCYDYDDETEEFKKMQNLIFSVTKNKALAEDATYNVVAFLKTGTDITSLEDFVKERYKISFDKKRSQQFNKLIVAMGLTFHLWSKWGNTGLTGMMNLLSGFQNEI